MASTGFQNLPLELRVKIIEECELSDRLSIARTSRDNYKIAHPLIYKNVDISYRDQPPCQTNESDEGGLVENSDSEDEPEEEYYRCQRQLFSFAKCILANPSFGELVRNLKWTVDPDDCLEKSIPNFWKALRHLTRVQRVDVCFFEIFSSSKALQFRKMISENLVSLELDNIQGKAQLSDDGYEYFDIEEGYPETEGSTGLPMIRYPGPMRGHLQPLIGRFKNLKHLIIRTVGQHSFGMSVWSEERERLRYTEMDGCVYKVGGIDSLKLDV